MRNNFPNSFTFHFNNSERIEFQDKYWPIMILITKYLQNTNVFGRLNYNNMLQILILRFHEGRIFRVVHHIWKKEGSVCSISVYLHQFLLAIFKCFTCQSLLCTTVCSIRDFKVCRRQRTYVSKG